MGNWFQFEMVVALVCRKLDYAVTRRGGANPDGGIDLLVEKNGERRAIQCKHWKTREVGVRHVREFLGALADAGVQKGSFVKIVYVAREYHAALGFALQFSPATSFLQFRDLVPVCPRHHFQAIIEHTSNMERLRPGLKLK